MSSPSVASTRELAPVWLNTSMIVFKSSPSAAPSPSPSASPASEVAACQFMSVV
jgi:hypothetical protein